MKPSGGRRLSIDCTENSSHPTHPFASWAHRGNLVHESDTKLLMQIVCVAVHTALRMEIENKKIYMEREREQMTFSLNNATTTGAERQKAPGLPTTRDVCSHSRSCFLWMGVSCATLEYPPRARTQLPPIRRIQFITQVHHRSSNLLQWASPVVC